MEADAPPPSPPPAPPRPPYAVVTQRTLPAGAGVEWWSAAWRLFRASPLPWIVVGIVYVAILMALTVVPLVGQIASSLVNPVLLAGFALACRDVDEGRPLEVQRLFAGFGEKLGALLVVGLVYLAGWLAIAFVAVAVVLSLVGAGALGLLAAGDPVQAAATLFGAAGLAALLAGLFALLLVVPLLMAFWFAPILVVFRGDDPIAAMTASFGACLANFAPFLVYGLLGVAFCVLACIPLFLGLFVFVPVAMATMYTSWRDVFGAAAAGTASS